MIESTNSIYSPWDKQTFGASVVSGTLDAMNGTRSNKIPVTDKASFGAAVVSTTLDYMNSPKPGTSKPSDMNNTYDLNQSVLGAAYSGIGTIVDSWA